MDEVLHQPFEYRIAITEYHVQGGVEVDGTFDPGWLPATSSWVHRAADDTLDDAAARVLKMMAEHDRFVRWKTADETAEQKAQEEA